MGNLCSCLKVSEDGNNVNLSESVNGDIHKVLFFPIHKNNAKEQHKMPCKYGMKCYRKDKTGDKACRFSHVRSCFDDFLDILSRSKSTLDISIFTITCNEIANCLIECSKRNVRIRIITDPIQMESKGSDIQQLAKTANITV
jgi:hypothetical protein